MQHNPIKLLLYAATLAALACAPAEAQQTSGAPGAAAADTISGQVFGAGAPIAGSTVTLWAATPGAPRQLAQTQTGADGRFMLSSDGNGANLYLVARGGRPTANATAGDNPAIALMTAVGSTPPANVVINEMTTIATVWTHAQFLEGDAIKGPHSGCALPRATYPALSASKPADGAMLSRDRSTAVRRLRWRTLPAWLTFSRVVWRW